MKKLLFLIFLFLFSSTAQAKIWIKPFDSIGVKNISRDITATECADNAIPKYDLASTKWQCDTDSTSAGAGGNSVFVSEETVAVFNNETADMIMNYGAAFDWSGAGQNRTVNINTVGISRDRTWSDGGSPEVTWTMDLAAGDPITTFKNGSRNFSGNLLLSGDLTIVGDNIDATTETDRFVFMANGSTYAPEAIDLGTDTVGGYAASVTEGGAATTATALASDPSDCAATNFATGIATSGNLTCSQPALGTDTTGSYAAGDAEAGAATNIQDDLIVKADFANEDWGDASIASNVFSLDADVVSNDEIATQAVSTDQLEATNKPTDGQVFSYSSAALKGKWIASAGGYTNLTSFVDQTAWRVFYSNGSGDVTELALGAANTVLTSNGASSAPTFETAGSGSKPNKEYFWPASATLPLEAVGDSIPPISKIANAISFDELTVDFDSSTQECRTVNFKVPPDVTSGGTVQIFVDWKHNITNGTGDVMWQFKHNSGTASGVSTDVASTVTSALASAADAVKGKITRADWTTDTTTAGFAASDDVLGVFCRDATNGSDTMSQDALSVSFGVSIPRT